MDINNKPTEALKSKEDILDSKLFVQDGLVSRKTTLEAMEEYAQQFQTASHLPERFIKPTDEQLVGIAILYNDGKLEQEKLADMTAMAMYIIDRLYENGNVLIPSSNEIQTNG